MKFGGTSVRDAAAIDRLCGIVSREPRNPLVVVSALSGVTDRLVALGEAASHGHSPSLSDAVDEIRSRHMDLATELVPAAERSALVLALDQTDLRRASSPPQRYSRPARDVTSVR